MNMDTSREIVGNLFKIWIVLEIEITWTKKMQPETRQESRWSRGTREVDIVTHIPEMTLKRQEKEITLKIRLKIIKKRLLYDRVNFVQSRGNDTIAFFIDSGCTDQLIKEKNYFCSLMILKNLIKIAIVWKIKII